LQLTAFRRREQIFSMIILLLLLLATLCVDAVAAYWWGIAGGGEASMALYYGLIFSQLSVMCIWASRCERAARYVWIAPFAAGLVAAWTTAALIQSGIAGEPVWILVFLCLFWIHAAALLALLWIWNQTRYGPSENRIGGTRPWQVSVMQLLVVTFVVAVLLTVWRKTPSLSESSGSDWIPWAINNVLVAIGAVVCFRISWSFFPRITLFFAWALCLGLVLGLVLRRMQDSLDEGNFALWTNLVLAIVLLIWLEVGGISSRAAQESSDEVSR
jgi:hypothetical protein